MVLPDLFSHRVLITRASLRVLYPTKLERTIEIGKDDENREGGLGGSDERVSPGE